MYRMVLFPLLAVVFLFQSCLTRNETYKMVAPGRWRAVLELSPVVYKTNDKKEVLAVHEQFSPGELPFEFDVTYTDPDHFYIELINGTERIRVDDIGYGRNKRTALDTVRINFPEYQSYITANVRGDLMDGHWVVTTKEDYRIAFKAKMGLNYRFTTLKDKPVADLSGEWAALFDNGDKPPSKAIGEFQQTENRLLGTFRTETGDYRYLDGTIQGNKFYMSCFDGSHAFLFSGKVAGDSLQGEFRSGTHYQTLWTAWRDPNFSLAPADSISQVTDQGAGIRFDFQTPEGQRIVYPSSAFEGKVKLFTISGTWCPNCKDELIFLRDYLAKHPEVAKQVEVVALSFERYKDSTQIQQHLLAYQKKLNLPFPVVLAGKSGAQEAQKVFPSLSKVGAFPTMIVLDKQNKVVKVHTGFDGPATSKYAAFEQSFDQMMQTLIK